MPGGSRFIRRATAVAAAVTAALAVAQPAGAVSRRDAFPVKYSLVGGFFADPLKGLDPNSPPAGSNDWSCKPSAEHPRPVILLHGLGGNQRLNWPAAAPLLANNGYCVFSLTYGNQSWLPPIGGLRSMRESAGKVADFVDRVRDRTGAEKVDLVGHSEGTTVASYYIKRLKGAPKVNSLVGFSPNYQGTELYGLTRLAQALPSALDKMLLTACPACKEYGPKTAFVKDLNKGGTAAVPGVKYYNIQGALEQVVLPNSSGRLKVSNATNVRVNSGCLIDLSDHVSLVTSPRANALMLNALDPAHPQPLPCKPNPPFLN